MGNIGQQFEQAGSVHGEARHDLIAKLLKADDSDALARTLIATAEIERYRHRTTAAIFLYEEAIALYRQSSDPLALAAALRDLADTYNDLDAADEADPLYSEALAIYRALDVSAA